MHFFRFRHVEIRVLRQETSKSRSPRLLSADDHEIHIAETVEVHEVSYKAVTSSRE